ncbi:MAG: hypothetical protein J5I98_34085 [Phaeodactylibacter sp.]|nr:hypothetical protein [Phaeodactylibacter sp.]
MPHTAILRPPATTFATGITTASLGQPGYEKALEQHRAYCAALRQNGLELILPDADERYPDGCFVEDTAIVTEELAILCRPGAASRRGEVAAVAEVLAEYRPLATIKPPGTVDGGDILRVDNHFFIGRSKRTNAEGARQLAGMLSECGFTLRDSSHLRSVMLTEPAFESSRTGERQYTSSEIPVRIMPPLPACSPAPPNRGVPCLVRPALGSSC